MDSLFKEELILLDIDANDNGEAIDQLSQCLFNHRYVNSEFIQAIREREASFPTGLPTMPFGTAIPHADSIYVSKTSIAVGILRDSVEFRVMGSAKDTVSVKLIFMIAQKEKKMQIDSLQRILGIIQDKTTLEKIISMKNQNEISQLLNKKYFC
jgi:PTS system galactitol-specific IIA component